MNEPKVQAINCLTPDEKWLKLWQAEYTQGDRSGKWSFVSRKPVPKRVGKDTGPDAVVILATISPFGHTLMDYLVVTSEYRIPIGGYEISLPAGLIDKGETPEQAALRELKEETGLDGEVRWTSPNLYSSAGMTDESVVMVCIKASGTISTAGCEASECIKPMLLSRPQLLDLMNQRGEFAGQMMSAKLWPLLAGMFMPL